MAKGKNLNPADALRKAQRKKELKKNKVERQKNRDFALVKKDTSELETEISELEGVAEPTNVQRARLAELKAELLRISKKKEEYVEAHPEQRGLVYKRRRETKENGEGVQAPPPPLGKVKRNLFKKNGLPRHPERSVYYDPVMNPYGMPPPGMPYVERALLPGEVDSDAEPEEASDDEDDDIAMPEGPPPGADDENLGSDDDIPLPEGPPPVAEEEESDFIPPLPPGPPPLPSGPPLTMPPFAPNLALGHPFPPPPPMGYPMAAPPFLAQNLPPPSPPPGYSYPQNGLPPPPPPPPGFFPRRGPHSNQSMASMQDPLTGIPHQTYQAHRATRQAGGFPSSPSPSTLPVNPNLPARPGGSVPGTDVPSRADIDANATISAAPQLRDFKKESTAFVPSALKRKKVGGTAVGSSGGRINAAPSVTVEAIEAREDAAGKNDKSTESIASAPKPDLLGSLRERFGPMAGAGPSAGDDEGSRQVKKPKVEKPKDDYDKFLAEMGSILGAP